MDQQQVENQNEETKQEEVLEQDESVNTAPEQEPEEDTQERDFEAELSESKDKYLRLYSEFENFRRRTSREKLDMINMANKDLMVDLLPVLDDFDRALKSLEGEDHDKAAMEGMELIAQKFSKILKQKGLKEIEANPGDDFNDELHEAITQIPPPKADLAGKIVDVVEKGYYLHDKVIRFSKVVMGAAN